jgi:hypothetical protein
VEELQQRMSSSEFTRWIAYSRIEPFGFDWERWKVGVLASSIVNAIYATIPVPKGRRRPKAMTPKDFYPALNKPDTHLTPEQAEHIRKKHGKRRHSNS